MTTLILARDMREASEYARLVGLRPHTWKFAYNVDNIRGQRPSHIIELPGFQKKVGRWAIEVEVKRAVAKSDIERQVVTDDSIQSLRSATVSAPVSQWRGVGEQLPLFDDLGTPKREKSTAARPAAKSKKATSTKPERVFTPQQLIEFQKADEGGAFF